MEQHPFIGTAGWSIHSRYGAEFTGGGSHLERYGAKLGCVEINSSFYKPHRLETYQRWAAAVPAGFRFSVKLPKAITHEAGLVDIAGPLDRFLTESGALGAKRAVLLVQLPPSLAFERDVASSFFHLLRDRTSDGVALEPRHASWFGEEAEALLKEYHIARVAADPPRHEGGDRPDGWTGLTYYRFHGAPRVYYSDYAPERLDEIASEIMRSKAAQTWCIFDNTAASHALGNALAVSRLVDGLK